MKQEERDAAASILGFEDYKEAERLKEENKVLKLKKDEMHDQLQDMLNTLTKRKDYFKSLIIELIKKGDIAEVKQTDVEEIAKKIKEGVGEDKVASIVQNNIDLKTELSNSDDKLEILRDKFDLLERENENIRQEAKLKKQKDLERIKETHNMNEKSAMMRKELHKLESEKEYFEQDLKAKKDFIVEAKKELITISEQLEQNGKKAKEEEKKAREYHNMFSWYHKAYSTRGTSRCIRLIKAIKKAKLNNNVSLLERKKYALKSTYVQLSEIEKMLIQKEYTELQEQVEGL